MSQVNLEEINFKEFISEAAERFPIESATILQTLADNRNVELNMESISIKSQVGRSAIATAIAPLEVLGLVELTKHGQAKLYSVTELGLEVLKLLK